MPRTPRTDREREIRRAQKKRSRDRRRALGLPAYTEAVMASRKASRQRRREKEKAIRAAEKEERLKLQDTPEWREAQAEKKRAAHRKWYANNIDKERIRNAIKKSQRKGLLKGMNELDRFVFVEAHYLRLVRNSITHFEWHVDHVIPVAKGGTNKYSNLQVVPAIWNLKKNAWHSERYFNNGR